MSSGGWCFLARSPTGGPRSEYTTGPEENSELPLKEEVMSKATVPGVLAQEPSLHETGTSLAWLADAPLFIDKEQVAGFYDAVVRPEGRRAKTVISLERYEGQTTKLEGAVEGEISV